MARDENEVDEIARRVVQMLTNQGMKVEPQKPEPKCELKWEDDALVLECESSSDRDLAKDILDKGDVIIKVIPKDEKQRKSR